MLKISQKFWNRHKYSSLFINLWIEKIIIFCISYDGSPTILLLDGPTACFDIARKRQIWAEIVAQKKKCAIILTTKSMEEANLLADKVIILSEGVVKASGTK